MPENFNEIPNVQKPEAEKPPEEKGDYSIFRDQYEAEKKKIIGLNRRIEQMEKFIAREKNAETAAKIRAGMKELKKQRQAAMDQASVELSDHWLSTRELQKMDDGGKTH